MIFVCFVYSPKVYSPGPVFPRVVPLLTGNGCFTMSALHCVDVMLMLSDVSISLCCFQSP